MKAQLAEQEVELTKKNEEADRLIEIVGKETEKVTKEKAFADEEEIKVNKAHIMAESDFFCAMLTSEMVESQQDFVELKGVRSNVLKKLLSLSNV